MYIYIYINIQGPMTILFHHCSKTVLKNNFTSLETVLNCLEMKNFFLFSVCFFICFFPILFSSTIKMPLKSLGNKYFIFWCI